MNIFSLFKRCRNAKNEKVSEAEKILKTNNNCSCSQSNTSEKKQTILFDEELIKKTFDVDLEYPNNPQYPIYTHKHQRGNSVEMLWVCEDCGYTSYFSYRNDMICADGIYYCKTCHSSQCLTAYYNGEYKKLECVECHDDGNLVELDGKTCPKCGGKVQQFNGIKLKQKYVNYNWNLADRNDTIFDTIERRDQGIM